MCVFVFKVSPTDKVMETGPPTALRLILQTGQMPGIEHGNPWFTKRVVYLYTTATTRLKFVSYYSFVVHHHLQFSISILDLALYVMVQ